MCSSVSPQLMSSHIRCETLIFFFCNDTATTEIYTLSLHDALPICGRKSSTAQSTRCRDRVVRDLRRSEEHTSELQSRVDIVCRLLVEKKKKTTTSARASERESLSRGSARWSGGA